MFPFLKYLKDGAIIPLEKFYVDIKNYIQTEVDAEIMREVFKKNQEEAEIWYKKEIG